MLEANLVPLQQIKGVLISLSLDWRPLTRASLDFTLGEKQKLVIKAMTPPLVPIGPFFVSLS